MKQAEVMVVLVILVLCNLALTSYLTYKVHNYTEAVDRHSRLATVLHKDTISNITKQIKSISKEIVVKNVLNIP